ncbi:hypothetical protein EPN52_12550 [bacterium]|nr:MAG: hypothetical protein EPN52_12550 [bacterium]
MRGWEVLLLTLALTTAGCAAPRSASEHAAPSPSAHRDTAAAGLPVALALDRLPQRQDGLSVDADRAAAGFVGPERTMVVAVPLSAGGRAGAMNVGVFRVAGDQPAFMSNITLSGGVRSLRIDGGRLSIATSAYRADDRLCCPSGTRTWTYGIMHGKPLLLQSNVTWMRRASEGVSAAAPAPSVAVPAVRAPTAAPPTVAPPAAMRTRALRSAAAPPESGGTTCTPGAIYAVAPDGSTVDTADGSVYRIAFADRAMVKQWGAGQALLICSTALVNEDQGGQRAAIVADE